ncbi:transposase [bacterium]|nr:transposase [bacterium]
MAKFKHYPNSSNWFFVTSTTQDFKPYFLESENAEVVINVLLNLVKRDFVRIDELVVMPEHIHAIIIPSRKTLSEVMRDWKKGSARLINKKDSISGRKIWMDEYHEEIVKNDNDLLNKRTYIHNNPVIRGLVDISSDFKYSTANKDLKERFNG